MPYVDLTQSVRRHSEAKIYGIAGQRLTCIAGTTPTRTARSAAAMADDPQFEMQEVKMFER
jgi:hypothetical protein